MPEHRIEGVGEVDAEDLLKLLEAENIHDVGAEEVGFSCLWIPGHANGDRNPSAHINRESLLWRCKGCQRAGSLLELVKIGLPDNASHVQALAWLRENFGEVVRAPRGGSLTADLEQRLEKARVYQRSLRGEGNSQKLPGEAETIGPQGIFHMDWRSDHEAAVYMRDVRGFAPEVLEDWGFGWDTWTKRVAIPVRNHEGNLVGFKGRAIDRDTNVKYLLLGDTDDRQPRYGVGYGFDMHDARAVLFGLDRAKGADTLVLCEGELNVVACHAAGVTNAVAPGTTSITDRQLWLLRAHADRLILFYDSDDAGSGAVWGRHDPENGNYYPGLVEKISPFFTLLDCDDHEGDPASMTPEQIRTLTVTAKHWIGLAFPSAVGV